MENRCNRDTVYELQILEPQMKKGVFISIEGIEGAGKTTLIRGLQDISIPDHKVIFTREPGGTDIAEKIRLLLTSFENKEMDALTELLLVYASRNEHIKNVIKPALADGHVVVTDRFYDASYAYQAYGRHIDLSILQKLDQWVVKNCIPDLTILLTAPVEQCLERVFERGNRDRFDSESASFFAATHKGYKQRADEDPARFHIFNSVNNEDTMSEEIKKVIINKVKTCSQSA